MSTFTPAPCPFCGGNAAPFRCRPPGTQYWYCRDCGVEGPVEHEDFEHALRWNTRVDKARLALEAALRKIGDAAVAALETDDLQRVKGLLHIIVTTVSATGIRGVEED